ncbi:hypothetical protein CEXT_678031 [Caerostris extrusa]|uniref:Flavin-containing monooxygenase n=1 Tax=Caerostris extrusa TaxID=172846 RepID=A0AAV4VYR4_CAEEX|nr:hypothetical protein CEXT_678031 [Caerostris extrusa]
MEDYIECMNDLAEEYGAKPEISTLFFKDFYLGLTCLTGPFFLINTDLMDHTNGRKHKRQSLNAMIELCIHCHRGYL